MNLGILQHLRPNRLCLNKSIRYMQFQGQPGNMPPRGPRNDWNRPPMQNFPQPPNGPPHQSGPGPMMQGPPRGPPPPQMGKYFFFFS